MSIKSSFTTTIAAMKPDYSGSKMKWIKDPSRTEEIFIEYLANKDSNDDLMVDINRVLWKGNDVFDLIQALDCNDTIKELAEADASLLNWNDNDSDANHYDRVYFDKKHAA